MSTLAGGRTRWLALAVAAAALLAAGALLLLGRGGEDGPPASAAARLVPNDALVLVDLSTDADREATGRAAELARGFTNYERLRETVLRRLSGSAVPVDVERDVEPWLGKEAALALLDTGTGTAGSLILVEVEDEGRARDFISRDRRPSVRKTYRDVQIDRYGTVSTAFADGWLLIGQDPSVQAAIDRSQGRGRTLDADPTYRRATADLPEGRAATAYASAEGLGRLLVPQPGAIGTIAALLDQPQLRGIALSVEAREPGARVLAHSILDRRRPASRAFAPTLAASLPDDALAYLGVAGATGGLGRLLDGIVAGTGIAGPALQRLRQQLDRGAGGRLGRDLVGLLRGEVALAITPSATAPAISLLARTDDERAALRTLRRVRGALGDALPGVIYQVARGRIIVSTSRDAAQELAGPDRPLARSARYRSVLGDVPAQVGSLGFIDFRQLLALGEQAGLSDSRTYLAARDDLQRISAVGVRSTESGGEATAEILVQTP
jgi:hypothetical protein